MSKRRIKNYIVITLLILEVVTLTLTYKTYQNKPKKEKEKINVVDKKTFSMYVEDDNGEYAKYTESELFPSSSKYTYNEEESYCIDIKEDIVDNVLSYNNGKVTVTSSKTVYCYLYFDQNKYDLQTNIYVENESGTYTALSEVPTSDTNYNYNVRYECSDNTLVKTFEYDYKNHNYNLITTGKNQCQIYFDEMEPDMSLKIYVDNSEVSEIPEGRYTINESKSTCSDSNATISYDESTNEIEIISSGITSCTVYLETKN